MAVYKVIQDIEAEDKLIGPLTLKSFIYAIIAAVMIFLSVRLALSGLGELKWAMIIMMLPPIALFSLLAAPIGKEQPTEVWLLSHARFFLKSKKRVWDKSGILTNVIITAPIKIEKQLTKNLSQEEVKSRLQALANALDSRGWALKNVDVNASPPSYYQAVNTSAERLVAPSNVSQSSPVIDIHAKDDIMDPDSNAKAQYFDNLMKKADNKRKKELLDNFNAMREGGMPMSSSSTYVPAPIRDEDDEGEDKSRDSIEQKIIDELHAKEEKIKKHPHFKQKPSLAEERRQFQAAERTRQEAKKAAETMLSPRPAPVTPEVMADRMELAKSGNAFSVASLSQLANRHEPKVKQLGPNEVEIDLH